MEQDLFFVVQMALKNSNNRFREYDEKEREKKQEIENGTIIKKEVINLFLYYTELLREYHI